MFYWKNGQIQPDNGWYKWCLPHLHVTTGYTAQNGAGLIVTHAHINPKINNHINGHLLYIAR